MSFINSAGIPFSIPLLRFLCRRGVFRYWSIRGWPRHQATKVLLLDKEGIIPYIFNCEEASRKASVLITTYIRFVNWE